MRTLLVSALALGAMTSAALAAEPAKPTPAQVEPIELAYAQAGPVELTDAQMDNVTAGTHRGVGGDALLDVTVRNVDVNVEACVAVVAEDTTCP